MRLSGGPAQRMLVNLKAVSLPPIVTDRLRREVIGEAALGVRASAIPRATSERGRLHNEDADIVDDHQAPFFAVARCSCCPGEQA